MKKFRETYYLIKNLKKESRLVNNNPSMAFKKYSFKNNASLSHFNWIAGGILWVFFSVTLYSFFYTLKEVFRFFSNGISFTQPSLILSSEEHYFTNLFFAAFASSLGYNFALRFVLQNPLKPLNWYNRFKTSAMLTNESHWTWQFLFVIGKLATALGFLHQRLTIQYDLYLWRDFKILFFLLPVVLFYSTWPNFNRVFTRHKFKWLFGLTIAFLALSFALSSVNLLDLPKLDSIYKKRFHEQAYDLKRPRTNTHITPLQRRNVNLYLFKDTTESETPIIKYISFSARVKKISISEMELILHSRNNNWKKNSFFVNMHIDKRLKMKYIRPILDSLRTKTSQQILFSTGKKQSKYPSYFPSYFNLGVPANPQPPYNTQAYSPLKIAKYNLDNIIKFELIDSTLYRNESVKKLQRINLVLSPSGITMEGKPIEKKDLQPFLYNFIKTNSPKYAIILSVEGETLFDSYIELLDIVHTQVNQLRNKEAITTYGAPFLPNKPIYWHEALKNQLPVNIIEWTLEEKQLQ